MPKLFSPDDLAVMVAGRLLRRSSVRGQSAAPGASTKKSLPTRGGEGGVDPGRRLPRLSLDPRASLGPRITAADAEGSA